VFTVFVLSSISENLHKQNGFLVLWSSGLVWVRRWCEPWYRCYLSNQMVPVASPSKLESCSLQRNVWNVFLFFKCLISTKPLTCIWNSLISNLELLTKDHQYAFIYDLFHLFIRLMRKHIFPHERTDVYAYILVYTATVLYWHGKSTENNVSKLTFSYGIDPISSRHHEIRCTVLEQL